MKKKLTDHAIAARIVDQIMKNLDQSTWGEAFHAAKEDLRDYKTDMVEDAEKIITRYR